VINKIDVPKTRVAIQQLFRTLVVVQWKGSSVLVGIIYLMGKLINCAKFRESIKSFVRTDKATPPNPTYTSTM
jgi:hypothetical protein